MTYAVLWMLNGRVPEPCLDLDRWTRWIEKADMTIAQTKLMAGDLLIATIFRPFQAQCGAFSPPPMLFKTVVYGESHLGELHGRPAARRDRIEARCYATWGEAEQGHAEIVERYRRLVENVKSAAAAAMAKPATKRGAI